MAQLHIDALTVPTFPNSESLRKTAKCITFWDPLIDLGKPQDTSFPCGSSPSGLRKTTKSKTVQLKDPIGSIINGISHKVPSLSSTKLPLSALKAHKPSPPATKPKSALKPYKLKVTITLPSTAAAQNIVTLNWIFPSSFNTIGNMSRTYTIRTNYPVLPVQQAW